jgi:hypothetical protein
MRLSGFNGCVSLIALAVAVAGSASAADLSVKAPPPAPFFLVNDTSVSFTWYPTATDPGVSGSSNVVPGGIVGQSNAFNKYVGTVTHFDVWKYGTNFFNLDFLQSDSRDPTQGIPGARGAVEVYGLARSTLSFNALSGTKLFSNFLVKDVSFEWGGDANTETIQLGSEKKDIVLGGQFALNLPGTVNFAVLAYKEWNHNYFWSVGTVPPAAIPTGTFAPGVFTGDREFKWIPRLELQISEPLTFLPFPLTWNSFTGVNFPKGTGISPANLCAIGGCGATGAPFTPGANPFTADQASAFTKTEVFADNRLTLDASKLAWGKSGIWDVYAGYRYWYNKFGTDHNAALFAVAAPGTAIESTAYLGTTYHFK